MSSNSNSLITRRRLLLALAASPLASFAMTGPAIETPMAGLRRWGSGEFRRFGFRSTRRRYGPAATIRCVRRWRSS
jgi:hypothetical protein